MAKACVVELNPSSRESEDHSRRAVTSSHPQGSDSDTKILHAEQFHSPNAVEIAEHLQVDDSKDMLSIETDLRLKQVLSLEMINNHASSRLRFHRLRIC